ncbi:MAG TPA: hypothetical protein VMV69_10720 [Pirellulales bacterium]|nr:hypothetical protein [Pirellulales bacterium]
MESPIKCARCGRTLDAPCEWKLEHAVCEACGRPNEPSAPLAAPRGAVAELLETAFSELPPPPPPARPGRKIGPWPFVAASALGLAAFGGAVALVASRLREMPGVSLTGSANVDKARQPPSAPSETELPDWTPDPDLVNWLPRPVRFSRWRLRLPEGFAPAPAPAWQKFYQGDLESWAWGDVPKGDSMLAAFYLDSGEMKRLNEPLTALVRRLTQQLQKGYALRDFESTLGGSERLGPRQFQRLEFQGVNARSERVYGTLFLSRIERQLLVLAATSPYPPDDDRHAKLVAALLTLE